MSRTTSTLVSTTALAAMMIHLVVSGDVRPTRILLTLACAGAVVIGVVLVDRAGSRTSRCRSEKAAPPPPPQTATPMSSVHRPAAATRRYARSGSR